jgi:hypothetical protein
MLAILKVNVDVLIGDSVMGKSSPKPEVQPAPEIVDEDDEEILKRKKREEEEQRNRSGRASTILSGFGQRLGG